MPHGIRFTFQLFRHQPVEQRGIGEVAVAVGAEEIGDGAATSLHVSLGGDEARAAVVRPHMRRREPLPDSVGAALPLGRIEPCRFLRRVIVRHGERHHLVERHRGLAVEGHQHGADRRQLEPLPDHGRRDAEPGGNVLDAVVGIDQRLERLN